MPDLVQPDRISQTGRRRRLALIVAGVAAALVAVLLVKADEGTSAGVASPPPPAASDDRSPNAVFDPVGWARELQDALAEAEKRICSPQYDYPGCSPAQQASLEAPNGQTFRKNYDKGRWGQAKNGSGTRAQWNNLTDAHNDKMRTLYANAVRRYESKMHAAGMHGKRAKAKYRTWAGFKSHMDCGGSFGWYTGLVNAWCLTQKPINWIVDNTKKVFLNCDTLTLTGAFTTGLASSLKWAATTLKVGTMQGAALAAVGRTVQLILDMIQDALGVKARQPGAMGDALAALDGRPRGQAAVVAALRG
jgi:hypothetical protein